MKKVPKKTVKKWMDGDFDKILKQFHIEQCENLTEEELRIFDRQLKLYNLEVNHFDNGEALGWFIYPRRAEKS